MSKKSVVFSTKLYFSTETQWQRCKLNERLVGGMNCLHVITIWIFTYKDLSKKIDGNLLYDSLYCDENEERKKVRACSVFRLPLAILFCCKYISFLPLAQKPAC